MYVAYTKIDHGFSQEMRYSNTWHRNVIRWPQRPRKPRSEATPKKIRSQGGGERREGKTWNPEIRQKLNGTYTNGTPFSKLRSSYILRFRGPFSGSCWRSLGLKTNILTLKIGRNDPKGEVTEPNHLIFRGEMLVSGSVVRKKDASTP